MPIIKRPSFIKKLRDGIPSVMLFTAVYTLVIGIIYYGIILFPAKIFGYTLPLAAMIYIILSGSAIILTTWGEDIERLIDNLFARGKIKGVLSEKKIRVILIFIYFIAIIVFTLASLTSHSVFADDKMDYSVIQSFATYIAYDRLLRNYPLAV